MGKKAAGLFIQSPPPPRAAQVARRVWVYRTVLDAIRSGALPPGARLPAARQLAADWRVARGSVDEAFELLQVEGFLQRRVGDGTYVSERPPGGVRPAAAPPALSQSAERVLERFAPYLGRPRHLEQSTTLLGPMPLFPRAPMTEGFALDTWARLNRRALSAAHQDLLGYGPAVGLDALREALARHVALTRGMACGPEQVVVVNGPLQALELIVRVLLEPGDTVWLEDPGHTSVPALLDVLRMRACPVALDARGFDVAHARRLAPHARAVYLHATTQFPLGTITDAQRRRELVDWAAETGSWIIDGNFNDELAQARSLPPALQQLDRGEHVIVMGTLEGVMFPSLRVAYLVAPARLVPVFAAMRGLLGDHTSMPTQQALAWFIDEGHLSMRIRDLRATSSARGDVLRDAVQRHVPDFATLGTLDGGTHACLVLPPDLTDMDAVREIRSQGVITVALSSMCLQRVGRNALVLGHAPFDAATIDQAICTIGTTLRRLRPRTPSYQPAGESR